MLSGDVESAGNDITKNIPKPTCTFGHHPSRMRNIGLCSKRLPKEPIQGRIKATYSNFNLDNHPDNGEIINEIVKTSRMGHLKCENCDKILHFLYPIHDSVFMFEMDCDDPRQWICENLYHSDPRIDALGVVEEVRLGVRNNMIISPNNTRIM
jgi:hypothetical protein